MQVLFEQQQIKPICFRI